MAEERDEQLNREFAAISCTVYLITDVLYGEPYGAVAAAVAAAVYASLWYGLALARAARSGR